MELPNEIRFTLSRDDARVVLAAVNSDATVEAGEPQGRLDRISTNLEADLDHRPWLNWKKLKGILYWEARIGKPGDGVGFQLGYYATCYRRGPWRLLIAVDMGDHHEQWGCFDAADQPMRYYHDPHNALGEAEKLAEVLLADRQKNGPEE